MFFLGPVYPPGSTSPIGGGGGVPERGLGGPPPARSIFISLGGGGEVRERGSHDRALKKWQSEEKILMIYTPK